MGKKKVIKKSEEEVLKETDKMETAVAKAATDKKTSSKNIENGRVYVSATYNNTLVSVTDDKGNIIAWSSAGSMGFSGPKKATPFAASKVVAAVGEKLKKIGLSNVSVIVKGVGGGSDSAITSHTNQGFNIISIKDVTPIPHNGPRPPKRRRI